MREQTWASYYRVPTSLDSTLDCSVRQTAFPTDPGRDTGGPIFVTMSSPTKPHIAVGR